MKHSKSLHKDRVSDISGQTLGHLRRFAWAYADIAPTVAALRHLQEKPRIGRLRLTLHAHSVREREFEVARTMHPDECKTFDSFPISGEHPR